MNPLQSIPALWRKRVYAGYFLVGVIFGAIQVGAAAVPDATQPTWLTVALVVYAYLGTALGLTAAANVGSTDTPPPAPAGDGPFDLGERGFISPVSVAITAAVLVLVVLVLVTPSLR